MSKIIHDDFRLVNNRVYFFLHFFNILCIKLKFLVQNLLFLLKFISLKNNLSIFVYSNDIPYSVDNVVTVFLLCLKIKNKLVLLSQSTKFFIND